MNHAYYLAALDQTRGDDADLRDLWDTLGVQMPGRYDGVSRFGDTVRFCVQDFFSEKFKVCVFDRQVKP